MASRRRAKHLSTPSASSGLSRGAPGRTHVPVAVLAGGPAFGGCADAAEAPYTHTRTLALVERPPGLLRRGKFPTRASAPPLSDHQAASGNTSAGGAPHMHTRTLAQIERFLGLLRRGRLPPQMTDPRLARNRVARRKSWVSSGRAWARARQKMVSRAQDPLVHVVRVVQLHHMHRVHHTVSGRDTSILIGKPGLRGDFGERCAFPYLSAIRTGQGLSLRYLLA